MKPTFVLAIHNSNHIDNFLSLGPSFEDKDINFIIHHNPIVTVKEGKLNTNFHHLVLGSPEKSFEDVLPAGAYTKFERISKEAQMVRINARAMYKKYDGSFLPLKTWAMVETPGKVSQIDIPNGIKIVARPKAGARGIGHFVIDTSKVNACSFHAGFTGAFRDSEDYKDAASVQAALDAMWPGAVAYVPGKETHSGEGVQIAINQGLCFTEYVENVSEEYRLITDHRGDIAYVQKRTRSAHDGAHYQASGAGQITESIAPDDFHQTLKRYGLASSFVDLSDMAHNVIGPMQSIDFFLTQDKRWGIFEYANQFGITGVPRASINQLHRDFVSAVAKRTLS